MGCPPVACAGFILAGQENEIMGGRKKMGGGQNHAKFFSAPPVFFSAPPAEINSAPPAEFDSAPGAEQTREGAENLIIPRKRGRNI